MEWKKDVHFLIIVTKLLKILKNSKQKKIILRSRVDKKFEDGKKRLNRDLFA
jgi:hypothetical protein